MSPKSIARAIDTLPVPGRPGKKWMPVWFVGSAITPQKKDAYASG